MKKSIPLMAGAFGLLICPVAMAQDEAVADRPQLLNLQEVVMAMPEPPIDAQRADKSLTVRYKLQIAGDGSVQNCDVTESSGDIAFDQEVCETIVSTANYDTFGAGPTSYSSKITFESAAERPASPADGTWSLTAFIEEDGTLSSCEWNDEEHPDVDPMPLCAAHSWTEQTSVGTDRLVRGSVTLNIPEVVGRMILNGQCRQEGFEDGMARLDCD